VSGRASRLFALGGAARHDAAMPRPAALARGPAATRRALSRGLVAAALGLGLGVGPSGRAEAALRLEERAERRVALRNLWTEETLDAVYWRDGAYLPEVLAVFDRLLRDRRTGGVGHIFPRLLDLLVMLGDAFALERPIGIISGFRSRATNAMLRRTTEGVSGVSRHLLGLALDVRAEGVPSERLFTAAAALGWGGTGLYRESDFVHLDLGKPRLWGI
jgi:uncharacterized protein YcbK (DUF882 family)